MDSPYHRLRKLLLDPRFFALSLVMVGGVVLVAFLSEALMPFFLALVLAYFLDGVVAQVMKWRNHRGSAVGVTYFLFLMVYLAGLIGPVQLAVKQVVQIAANFPLISERLQEAVFSFFHYLSAWVTVEQQEQLARLFAQNLKGWGEGLLSHAVGSIQQVTTWSLYLLLVPLLVFFFLKDKKPLLSSFTRLLPREKELVVRVWEETEGKLANYVRGKVWEILIVCTVSYAAFFALGFRYGAVMALVSGLSVVIPFVGAIGAAIPLIILGYVQWGGGWELGSLTIAYAAIQVLDGNLLAPLIFSEAVKLHPVFIFLAVFVFGSLWGFWGVFFAIPLATLVKSVFDAIGSLSE